MEAKLIKTEKGYHLDTGNFDGIHLACYPHDVTKQRLSLKNCQAIENGYDLEHICWQLFGGSFEARNVESEEEADKVVNFGIECFQKALELMGDKKFSEEDVMLGWDAGVMSQSICFTNYFGLKRESELKSHRESYQGNLKPSALQQTEWDVEIEMKKVKDKTKIVGAVKGVKGSGNRITTYKSVPKLDADGCLILKIKSE
jgi:hypothetical protein